MKFNLIKYNAKNINLFNILIIIYAIFLFLNDI
jgi:hypothetical protein